MKHLLYCTMFLFLSSFSISVLAQNAKPSPASTATGKAGDATVTINYGAPSVKGRKIWGELVPFGKVWRTGANDATTFEIDTDVKIEGQALAKGKYALFTIPEENEWTIIFNKNPKQWGSYSYKQEEDVLRVKVKAGKSSTFNEKLAYEVSGNKVFIRWENAEVAFKVK
jgi:hypothetical protein